MPIIRHQRDRRTVSRATPVRPPFVGLTWPMPAAQVIDNGLDPDLDTSFLVADSTGIAIGDVIFPAGAVTWGASPMALVNVTSELMLVTNITGGGLNLTVTRGYAGTTPVNLSDGWTVGVLGVPTLDEIAATPDVTPIVGSGLIGVDVVTPGGVVVADSVGVDAAGDVVFGFPSAIYDWSMVTVSSLAARIRSRGGQPLASGSFPRLWTPPT